MCKKLFNNKVIITDNVYLTAYFQYNISCLQLISVYFLYISVYEGQGIKRPSILLFKN